LEKKFETLDFSSLKCYKRVKKEVYQNSKYKKNDKSNRYRVQNYDFRKPGVAVILNNLSQLIGELFLFDSSAYFETTS